MSENKDLDKKENAEASATEDVSARIARAKNTGGRPTRYNKEQMDEILFRMSEGEPLRKICREPNMPAWRTIYDWLEKDADLLNRFSRARDLGGDAIFEETLEIADNPNYGLKEVIGKDGSTITKEDMLGHRKLQVETRFKLLSKWNPKKYGDRTMLSGDKENPISMDVNIFDEMLKNLELKRQAK
jgi:hypothetical protein